MKSALIELKQMDVDTIACGVPRFKSLQTTGAYNLLRKKKAVIGGILINEMHRSCRRLLNN
jgi:hypothetical protein